MDHKASVWFYSDACTTLFGRSIVTESAVRGPPPTVWMWCHPATSCWSTWSPTAKSSGPASGRSTKPSPKLQVPLYFHKSFFVFHVLPHHTKDDFSNWNINIMCILCVSLAQTCGGVLSDKKGEFTSPHHPSLYPPALDCKWTIKVCYSAPLPRPPRPPSSTSAPRAPPPPLPSLACHERNAEAAVQKPSCSVPLLSSSVRPLLLPQL